MALIKLVSYISHSKSYRAAANYGQKVLCVGYSSSGINISQELLDRGRDVYVALRYLDNKKELDNLQSSKKAIKFISSPQKLSATKEGCI